MDGGFEPTHAETRWPLLSDRSLADDWETNGTFTEEAITLLLQSFGPFAGMKA
jgi:hypothetical protein